MFFQLKYIVLKTAIIRVFLSGDEGLQSLEKKTLTDTYLLEKLSL